MKYGTALSGSVGRERKKNTLKSLFEYMNLPVYFTRFSILIMFCPASLLLSLYSCVDGLPTT